MLNTYVIKQWSITVSGTVIDDLFGVEMPLTDFRKTKLMVPVLLGHTSSEFSVFLR